MANKKIVYIISPRYDWASHHEHCTKTLFSLLQKSDEYKPIIATPQEILPKWIALFYNKSLSYKKGEWGLSSIGKYLAALDSLICLFFVLKKRKNSAIYHWIDGSFLVLSISLLFKKKTVYSLYGNLLPKKFISNIFSKSIKRNTLHFIYETIGVLKESSYLLQHGGSKLDYLPSTPSWQGSQEQARKELNLPLNGKILIIPGTVRSGKDYDFVFKHLNTQSEKNFLFISGKKIDSTDINSIASKYTHVKWLWNNEYVSPENYSKSLIASDIVILPYEKNYSKGSGSIFDANVHGKISIAIKCPTFSNFKEEHPNTCFLFDKENPNSFIHALDEANSLASLPEILQIEDIKKRYLSQLVKIYNNLHWNKKRI